MADETYHPRGSHPEPSGGISSNLFRSIEFPGYLVGDFAFLEDGTFYKWDGTAWNEIEVSSGGGTTQIATGTSDPVGAPAAGIVFFSRTDVVRLLRWTGSDWRVEYSEI